jgi:hypothetical protein
MHDAIKSARYKQDIRLGARKVPEILTQSRYVPPKKTSITWDGPFSFLSQNSLDYFAIYAIMVLHG